MASGAGSSVQLEQGEELGRFLLGSTVIVAMPADARVRIRDDWQAGRPIRMGEAMADSGAAD